MKKMLASWPLRAYAFPAMNSRPITYPALPGLENLQSHLLTKRVSYVSENLRATKPAKPEAKPASNIGQWNSTGSGTQSLISPPSHRDNQPTRTQIIRGMRPKSEAIKCDIEENDVCLVELFMVVRSGSPRSTCRKVGRER